MAFTVAIEAVPSGPSLIVLRTTPCAGLLVGLRHFSSPAAPPGSHNGGAGPGARSGPLWSPLALAAIPSPHPAHARPPLASLGAPRAPFVAANSPDRRRPWPAAGGGSAGAAGAGDVVTSETFGAEQAQPGPLRAAASAKTGPCGCGAPINLVAVAAAPGAWGPPPSARCGVANEQLPFGLESWGSAALATQQHAGIVGPSGARGHQCGEAWGASALPACAEEECTPEAVANAFARLVTPWAHV